MTEKEFMKQIKEGNPERSYVFLGTKDGCVYAFNNEYFSVKDVESFARRKFECTHNADFVAKPDPNNKGGVLVYKDRYGTFRSKLFETYTVHTVPSYTLLPS